MKVVIIEDEKHAAQKLANMIKDINPHIEILNTLESIETSVNWLSQNHSPDLIFMDIQLDDGLSFEIFETLAIKTPVIFTTAYNQYALKAFKVNSVDYLLKPIQKEDLQKAIDKFSEIYNSNNNYFSTEVIKNLLANNYKKRYFIKVGLRYKSIAINDINCFYILNRNAFLLTSGGKSYDIDLSLEKIEVTVDPEKFFRVNRNFMVNINAIADIIFYSSSRLKVVINHFNDEEIIVSRDKTRAFKKWLDK